MIKAAVFDLDHTLFDRYETLRLVIPMFREHFKIAPGITDEYFHEKICFADKQFVHFGWEKIHAYLVEAGIFAEVPDYEEYKEYLLSCFSKVAVKYPFSAPMLDELRDMGILTGLITNGRHPIQSSKLRMLELEDKFDSIIISGDTPYSKPQTEIFELAAERLGIRTDEMIFVGDHPISDIDGSRNAGCIPVWVKTTGTWVYPDIEKPELQVENVTAIPDIIRKLNK